MSAKLLSHFFPQTFFFLYFYELYGHNHVYKFIYKKKKKLDLHVDNEGCVMNLRYKGYVHFLKENKIQNYVGKGEIAFNEHEQFLLSHYVC